MSAFKTPQWESNTEADKTCTELFNKTKHISLKSNKPKARKNNKAKDRNTGNKHELNKSTKTVKKAKSKIDSSKGPIGKVKNILKGSNKDRGQKLLKKVAAIKTKQIVKRIKRVDKVPKTKISKVSPKQKVHKIEEEKERAYGDASISEAKVNEPTPSLSKEDLKIKKFKQKIVETIYESSGKPIKRKSFKNSTLRERMIEKLKAARFRYLNEELYTKESGEADQVFNSDPQAFKAYHAGYQQQVSRWPLNPLDSIIAAVKKMSHKFVIADFGCGEAKLAASVPQKVHSFDLVALNPVVTACNMAHCPLESSSVDVVIFCLSLMGTNLKDYLLEANRVLKVGGIMKIAEVESRFETPELFIKGVERYNFTNTWKDLSHNLFYFLDFKKLSHIKHKNKLPTVGLHPCMYKKR